MIVVIPALNPDFHLTNLVNELKLKPNIKLLLLMMVVIVVKYLISCLSQLLF